MTKNNPELELTQTEEIARINFIKLRRTREFTQEFVANEMDIERSFIGFIEAGTKRLSLRHLDKLKGIFNCDVREFFTPQINPTDKNTEKNND